MIEVTLRRPGRPRVLGVYSFRFDAPLVPAMLANTAPLVDGWVSFDDRGARGLFSDEIHRRLALLEKAVEVGADWVLAIDPDERFERRCARAFPMLLDNDATVHSFRFRELFARRAYRVDGVWGRKRQARLLDVRNGLVRPEGELHIPWHAFIENPTMNDTDLNMYHLKMIDPRRRQARAALYEHLDPDHRMQAIGYAYLADERDQEIERIPWGRGYRPRHHDDGGLWMADRG